MSLQAHYDASDTDEVFTTYQGSGVHTGTPADGDPVQVWDEEAGHSDQCFTFPVTSAQAPNFRSGGSALMVSGLSELDFDGAVDKLQLFDQTGGSAYGANTFMGTNWAWIFSLYPEVISATSANPFENHCLVGAANQNWGIFFRNDGGVRKVQHYAFDGANKVAELAISLSSSGIVGARYTSGGDLIVHVSDSAGSETTNTVNSVGLANIIATGLFLGQLSDAFYNGRIGEFKQWDTGDADGTYTTEFAAFKTKWLSGAAPPTTMGDLRPNRLRPSIFTPGRAR